MAAPGLRMARHAKGDVVDLGGSLAPPPGVDVSRFMAPVEPAPIAAPVRPADIVLGNAGTGGMIDPTVAQRAEAHAADDELRRRAADAEAALAARSQVQGPMDLLTGNYRASQDRTDDLWDARRKAMGTLVSRANPLRPMAERVYGEAMARDGELPPIEPEPFVAPERMAGESPADYLTRLTLAEDSYRAENAYAQQAWDSRVPSARDVGKNGNIGEIEAERRIGEDMARAQMDQAERLTAMSIEHARAKEAAIAQTRAAVAEQQARMQQASMAVEQAQRVEQDARKKLEAMPAMNGSKFTDNMGAGSIIAALVGAFAGGFSGQGSMSQHLADLNARSLEEQKLNYDMGVQAHANARDGANQAMDVYRSIRDGIGDEQAAGMMYLNMLDEQQLAALSEEEAATTLPQVKAQIQQERLQHEQQLRARRDQLQLHLMQTPERITSRVGADPFRQKMAEQELMAESKHRRDMEMKGVDVVADESKARAAADLERQKQERADLRGEGGVYKEAAALADKIAEPQMIVSLIDDLKREYKDGIPGVGPWAGTENAMEWASGVAGGKNEAHSFRMKVRNAVDIVLRERTGAVAPPEEVDFYTDLMLEGSEDIGGEAKVWDNLENLARPYRQKIEVHKRGRSKAAQSYLTNNAQMAPDDAIDLGVAPARDVVRRK